MSSTKELIAERGKTHGDYSWQALTACQLKQIIETGNKCLDLSAVQRDALDMICVKISRIVNGDPDFRDHWADIAGYATLVAERCSK
jgi:hypothetical protein